MELKCMLVTVTDMERARKFYEDIFGLELLQDNDGNMLWIYRCGETACPEDWKPQVRA